MHIKQHMKQTTNIQRAIQLQFTHIYKLKRNNNCEDIADEVLQFIHTYKSKRKAKSTLTL